VSLAKSGIPVAGITSNTVPWELIRAAGIFPCMINSGNSDLADIGRYMEDGVFEERIRAIFGAAISGDLQHLGIIVIPRTSEQEYKLYLYLREVARLHPEKSIPPVYLYDLLHTRSPEAGAYGLERTACLKKRLEESTGAEIGDAALRDAIREANAARNAVRKLLSLRGRTPRISGTEALALVGASFFMIREEYARLAERAAEILAGRDPLGGKRLMVSGASLNHRGLHRALEEHGAVVVAEDDWWGSRSAGDDIAWESCDLLKAIFEKYYLDAPSPRLFPFETADAWFQQATAEGVGGVVFYLPPEDCVDGWDYPRRRRFLDDRGIPHLLVREDAGSISEECHERIERFVCSISGGR
jgi:benzoyl-CoA reductase/2-hydroxyglutaryl-CoA dehydratase subunit BcrC/BadD/HgdB